MSRFARVSKVVETTCLDGLPHSRVSKTARIRERSDDDGSISLAKRPAKRRKSKGLDSRLSRMLNKANSALIADDSSICTGRSRIESGSSSSSVINTAPKTPVESLRCDRTFSITIVEYGQRSPIGELTAASDVSPTTSPAHTLISTRRTRKARSPKPLPNWLAKTFTTLEPAHPLRLLAEANDGTPADGEYSSPFLFSHDTNGPPAAVVPHADYQAADEDLFAYMPPAGPHDMRNEADAASHANSSDETLFDPHLSHYATDHTFLTYPIDTPAAPDYVTLSSADPFAFATDHLAHLHQSASSDLSFFQDNKLTSHLPFSTPGPASRFTTSAPALKKLLSLERDAFHDALLALEGNSVHSPSPTRVPISHSTHTFTSANDAIVHEYQLHHATVPEVPLDNRIPAPFSTPGPLYCAPPVIYFDSPTEDPTDSDPLEPAYDDVVAEMQPTVTIFNQIYEHAQHDEEVKLDVHHSNICKQDPPDRRPFHSRKLSLPSITTLTPPQEHRYTPPIIMLTAPTQERQAMPSATDLYSAKESNLAHHPQRFPSRAKKRPTKTKTITPTTPKTKTLLKALKTMNRTKSKLSTEPIRKPSRLTQTLEKVRQATLMTREKEQVADRWARDWEQEQERIEGDDDNVEMDVEGGSPASQSSNDSIESWVT